MSKAKKKLKTLNKILNVYSVIGLTLWAAATVLIFTPALPYLWYTINPKASQNEVNTISDPTKDDSNNAFAKKIQKTGENIPEENTNQVTLPKRDESLTETNTLLIPKIGIVGEIHESQKAEAGLSKGVWRVYDYGTPEDIYPIILASHRFGYLHWTNDYRTKNSFYNLPKTSKGDQIVIIWNQRRYEYEIYKTEDGEQINDYDADLILYTCKMLNSPVRIFRYAKRIN
jgi:sortase (surface protein transpeptidase)